MKWQIMAPMSMLVVLCFALWLVSIPSLITWAHGAGGEPELQCEEPRGETLKLTINGGREFAGPGEVFGFDVETIRAKRCQKVEVTFINTDKVRHAFMVDGLEPVFMIEIAGRGQKTASFIAPDKDVTLLLHCHVPAHDRAGMSGAAIIGSGDNDFAGYTGLSKNGYIGQSRQPLWISLGVQGLTLLGGFIVGILGYWLWMCRSTLV